VSVVAVFIASEENSDIPEVGIEVLDKRGYLDNLKHGWVIWVDTADCHPIVGPISYVYIYMYITVIF